MHYCGFLQNESRIFCWGDNTYGQLGDGTTVSRNTPTQINDTSTYINVSVGYNYACAIRQNDSRVLCWGSNSNGQLGLGLSMGPIADPSAFDSFLADKEYTLSTIPVVVPSRGNTWTFFCRAITPSGNSSWANSSAVVSAPAEGNASDINVIGVSNITVEINGIQNITDTGFGANATVNISSSAGTILVFNYNFTISALDFTAITMENGINGTVAYTYVSGINSSALVGTKTLYLYDANPSYTHICIKDEEGASYSNISASCTGSNEHILACDGTLQSNYTCTMNGTNITVTGLAHSAVIQFAPPLALIVSIISPASNQNSSSANVLVNVTLNGTGTEISDASFRVDGVEVAAYSNTSNTANCSATVPGSELYRCVFSTTLTDGAKSLNVTAYDYGAPAPGKIGSAIVNFTVDTSAPTLILNAPANDLNISYANVTFNWTATDALRASITCNLIIDGAFNKSVGAINGTSTTTSATSNLSDGPHNWSVSCWDDLNNTNSTTVYNFTVDTVAPIVNLLSPANQTNVSATSIAFKFNATDALPINCSLYIDEVSRGTNASVANNTETSWTVTVNANTNHSWYVACTDNAGNNNVSGIQTLLVDTAAPAITLALPDGSNLASNVFTLNFVTLDALSGINSSACKYSINNGANVSVPNCANTTVNTSVTNGQVNFTIYSSDMVGNLNSSNISFRVDMVALTISISVPNANSVLSNNSTTLNFTAVDTNTGLNSSTCYYKLNGVRTNIMNCANMMMPEMSNGAQTLIVYAKDNVGNEGSNGVSFVVDVSGTNTTVPLNNTTSLSNNASVVVTPYSPAANLTLGSNATNVSLNMSDISTTNGSITSVNLTNPINMTANTSLGNVVVRLPGNLTINGSSSWNGVLYLPSVQVTAGASPTDSGTNAVNGVVQLGFTGEQLNFSNAVRILISGMGGKLAGYVRGTTFTKITVTCTTDSQTWADANLGAAGDCVTSANSGVDMVIWTKHFTQFVAYTNTPPSSDGNTDSGGSGDSGGGSVGGGSSSASVKQSATLNVDVGLGKTCEVTITREMASATNISTLTTTLENVGGSECAMTEFVFADTIPSDFPAFNEVTFNPQYASRDGWMVAFNFPTFAAGESKTLTYSANQWINALLAKNFTVYTMSAKKQAATQPATNTTATPIVEAPSVWIPGKLPVTPSVQSVAQPTPTPPIQPDNTTAMILPALVVIVVGVGIVGLALYMKGKKKHGL